MWPRKGATQALVQPVSPDDGQQRGYGAPETLGPQGEEGAFSSPPSQVHRKRIPAVTLQTRGAVQGTRGGHHPSRAGPCGTGRLRQRGEAVGPLHGRWQHLHCAGLPPSTHPTLTLGLALLRRACAHTHTPLHSVWVFGEH